MNEVEQLISSGILELYVLDQLDEAESALVEQMAAEHELVRLEIDAICHSLEQYALANAKAPSVLTGPFLMAKIDFMTRMQAGEDMVAPPVFNASSSIADYRTWFRNPAIANRNPVEDIEIHIIASTPEADSAVVWLKDHAPEELHEDEIEQFMILEGSCDIIFDDEVKTLKTGDVFFIPLHRKHSVKVTSEIPCKIFLQRVAA